LGERAVVAVIRLDFRIPFSRSLKEKRSVVKSFMEKARNRFFLCAVESGKNDSVSEASLTLSGLSANGEEARKVLRQAVEFLEDNYQVQVTGVVEEVF